MAFRQLISIEIIASVKNQTVSVGQYKTLSMTLFMFDNKHNIRTILSSSAVGVFVHVVEGS